MLPYDSFRVWPGLVKISLRSGDPDLDGGTLGSGRIDPDFLERVVDAELGGVGRGRNGERLRESEREVDARGMLAGVVWARTSLRFGGGMLKLMLVEVEVRPSFAWRYTIYASLVKWRIRFHGMHNH